MDRNDYNMLASLVCYERSCRKCGLDHNHPCYKTSEAELVDYVRELYNQFDPTVFRVIHEHKDYYDLVKRILEV